MADLREDFAQYAEHRTDTQIRQLLHYGHWIPILRGKTDVYLAEHYPGWTWNELWEICQAAGIVVREPDGRFSRRLDVRVKAFHFTDTRTFAVEWEDGSVSTDPDDGPPPLGPEAWASWVPCPRRGQHEALTDCWMCWSDVHRGACLEEHVVKGAPRSPQFPQGVRP